MPRKNPISEKEAVICQRLKQFRLDTKLSRVAFARQTGLDSSTLSSIEHLRAPLRYSVAKKICEAIGISFVWLAEGRLQNRVLVGIPKELDAGVSPHALFSEVYEQRLKAPLEAEMKSMARTLGVSAIKAFNELEEVGTMPIISGSPRELAIKFYVDALVRQEFQSLPDPLLSEFFKALQLAVSEFQKKHKKEIEAFCHGQRKKPA